MSHSALLALSHIHLCLVRLMMLGWWRCEREIVIRGGQHCRAHSITALSQSRGGRPGAKLLPRRVTPKRCLLFAAVNVPEGCGASSRSKTPTTTTSWVRVVDVAVNIAQPQLSMSPYETLFAVHAALTRELRRKRCACRAKSRMHTVYTASLSRCANYLDPHGCMQ